MSGGLNNLANLPLKTDSNGYLLVTIGGGNWTPDKITLDSANLDIVLWRQAAKTLQIDADGAGAALTLFTVKAPLSLNGKITTYNAVAAVGQGVPSIYASGRVVATTGAVASLATYTPPADGMYEISGDITMTAFAAGAVQLRVAYTSEENTGRTLNVPLWNANAWGISAGSVDVYVGGPITIRAKAGVAIVLSMAGTFTTLTYNAEGTIKQIA